MNKFIKGLAATGAVVAFSVVPLVGATPNCTISNTGPNSVNTCVNDEVSTVTVTCTNGIKVTNLNSQFSTSGTATVDGNTISANAISGPASNINSLTTDLTANCAQVATVPATTTTTTPVTPASGAGAGAGPVVTTPVKALPKTGKSSLVAEVAIGAAGLLAIAVVAQSGVATYRRSSK